MAPKSKVGTFSDALMDEANDRGWVVISMKNDWKRILSRSRSRPRARKEPGEHCPSVQEPLGRGCDACDASRFLLDSLRCSPRANRLEQSNPLDGSPSSVSIPLSRSYQWTARRPPSP